MSITNKSIGSEVVFSEKEKKRKTRVSNVGTNLRPRCIGDS